MKEVNKLSQQIKSTKYIMVVVMEIIKQVTSWQWSWRSLNQLGHVLSPRRVKIKKRNPTIAANHSILLMFNHSLFLFLSF